MITSTSEAASILGRQPRTISEAQKKRLRDMSAKALAKRWGNQLDRFWKHVDRRGPDDCWPWMAHTANGGYGELTFNGRQQRAHRIAYLIHYGTLGESLCVLHKCDNPPCCNPAHLFQGTKKDNTDDMCAKKRNVFFSGEQCPNATVTEATVRAIRADHATGEWWRRRKALAAKYHIPEARLKAIIYRLTWKHI